MNQDLISAFRGKLTVTSPSFEHCSCIAGVACICSRNLYWCLGCCLWAQTQDCLWPWRTFFIRKPLASKFVGTTSRTRDFDLFLTMASRICVQVLFPNSACSRQTFLASAFSTKSYDLGRFQWVKVYWLLWTAVLPFRHCCQSKVFQLDAPWIDCFPEGIDWWGSFSVSSIRVSTQRKVFFLVWPSRPCSSGKAHCHHHLWKSS